MGIILDESMLVTYEGVEGEGSFPARSHSIFCENPSIKFQYYLLDKCKLNHFFTIEWGASPLKTYYKNEE